MDQERFDQLARKISSASSRRTMLGGMVAGLFGAGIAKLGDAAAKTGKTKHKKVKTHKDSAKGKKGKDSAVHKEQVVLCAGPTDAVNCPNGCCLPVGATFQCIANGQGGLCGIHGQVCSAPVAIGQCCDPISGTPVAPPAANPATGTPGTCGTATATIPGGVCQACPNGCCAAPAAGQFGTQCKANGTGNCGLLGVPCNSGTTCDPTIPANGSAAIQCCTSSGNCTQGVTVSACSSGRNLCQVCPGPNQTCLTGACQAGPACPAPLSSCSGACVDLGNNAANCGACGRACPACPTGTNAVCAGGACGCTTPPPTCPVGLISCSCICVDLATNPANCGACAKACPACGKGRSILCTGGACGCTKKKKKHHHHH